MTGKTVEIDCPSSSTIGEVKIMFTSKRVLLRTNKGWSSLADNSKTKVRCLTTIFLRKVRYIWCCACGGGISSRLFADVSDDAMLREHAFSHKAPEWRMCNVGLNLEGRCENRACDTSGQMVIHRKRLALFNLVKDGKVQCPKCLSKVVTPITCGFYNCVWKFEGLKASDGFFVSSPWRSAAGEKYHRFDADEVNGSIEWKSLLIMVKPLDKSAECDPVAVIQPPRIPANAVCGTCWSKVGSTPTITAQCGHCFHGRCYDKWSEWCEGKSKVPSCSICNGAAYSS